MAELDVPLLPEPFARALRHRVYDPPVHLVADQESRKKLAHDAAGGEHVRPLFELHSALEPYAINIPTKFAQTIAILLYTSFYAIFFPPGIIFTLVGLLFHYWIGKVSLSAYTQYLMINRYKVPRIGGHIAVYSMDLIGLGCMVLFVVLQRHYE